MKTILILFMLAVNVALLLLWGTREYIVKSADDHSRNELLALLAKQGLHAAHGVIPDETVTAMTLEISRDTELEERLAETLIGTSQAEHTGGNRVTYHGPGGRAGFDTGGEFFVEPDRPYPFARGDDPLASALSLLSHWGDESGLLLDQNSVLAAQEVLGLPIWNGEMVLTYDEAGFTGLSGRWVLGSPAVVRSLPGRSAGFCLLRFSDGQEHEILSVALGYSAAAIGPETVRLTPVWQITLENGVHYIDAVTATELGK